MNIKLSSAMVVLAACMMCVLLWSASTAQEAPRQQVIQQERFQVAAWAYPAFSGGGRYTPASHGAYIVDSQTGEMWIARDSKAPKSIGSVAKK